MTYRISIGDRIEWADPYAVFENMHEWAVECCESYVTYKVADTSDVSGYDYVGSYYFNDYNDSLAFKLKWKQS
jgi:hypothetical protein